MKAILKHICILCFVLLLNFVLSACNNSSSDNLSKFTAIEYENIPTVENIDEYQAEVVKDGINNDDPVENGVVTCPYYTLTINDQKVQVYSTRCATSVHSFAWIDVEDVQNLVLNVKLELKNYHKNVVVLPESSGVKATLENNIVTCKITSLGSFSIAFDRKVEEALTLYVALKEELNVPDGYALKEFNPGTYKAIETTFKDGETVYLFKKGVYNLSSIYLPSNSILYLEPGTYFNVVTESLQDRNAAIRSSGTKNIQVCGRGLFDFSQSKGGEAKFKGVFNFHDVSEMTFSGITSINSNSWSVCFTDCDNVLVEELMLLGYRTFSDGIMMSDCQDSLIRNNFVRTGDDAIEVKSTGSEGTSNMIYEYNAIWTDKARGYGCIYEANNSVKNVVFRNNSIGFALATWTDDLGCCIVVMGDRRTTTWEDIHFENIEIYISYHALVNVTLEDSLGNGVNGGKAKDIYFENITAYRSYGLAARILVQNGSTLGKVYLDNIRFNDKLLQESSLSNKDEVSVVHYSSSWAKSNLKINTNIE